jgi:hypothetical protein
MFTRPVKPGETLLLNIPGEELGEDTLFSLKLANSENIVCSGLIIAQKTREHTRTVGGGEECENF